MASALAVGAAHGKKPHPVSIFGTTIVLYLALASFFFTSSLLHATASSVMRCITSRARSVV
jgi:hypothetical protein